MLLVTRSPGPALAPYVEYFWSLSDAPGHSRERIVPSGTFELVINLRENGFRIYDAPESDSCRQFSGAMVSGAYGKPFVIDTRAHASILGVHFRPGGAHPFLGVAADRLVDAHVDLDTLWGSAAGELRERLCGAPTTAERFRLLESYLTQHLRLRHAQRRAVSFALSHLRGDGVSVARLAKEIGMSHRRFIEVFAAQVGMPPKRFDRIQRFQRVVSSALASQKDGWSQLALDCGYFDHPHLLRDFVAFSGVTPPEYLRRQREAAVKVNHLPIA
jgi:AraC-like DNA-binding protein